MSPLHGLFAAISAVILFLYGLQGFSRELQAVGGATLQSWLGRVTANRGIGFLVGAAATAIVQSSSAITALTVTLVDMAANPGIAVAWAHLLFNLTIALLFLVTRTGWSRSSAIGCPLI
jgi:Na+/phosphate symporter